MLRFAGFEATSYGRNHFGALRDVEVSFGRRGVAPRRHGINPAVRGISIVATGAGALAEGLLICSINGLPAAFGAEGPHRFAVGGSAGAAAGTAGAKGTDELFMSQRLF